MNRMVQSLACVGLSAMLLAGCGGMNNAGNVTTKSINKAGHLTAKSMNQAGNIRQHVLSRPGGNQAVGHTQTASPGTRSHILQLGNWMRIEGTSGETGLGARSMAGNAGRSARKGRGIPNYQEQSADQAIHLTVRDPKAIQAIDRINKALSSGAVRAKSGSLVKDLSYVLQHASLTSETGSSGMSTHGR
ncbi:hypothetical protein [Cohnella zeiphila]|uniref:Sporulation protein n=1 Tax=Cohnella zeiphila TaxID=2761120 RepID=A0A7X0SVR6_9BACL|nr:hypothetical protein [Cohnella zeiphila]MBB6734793.1 hypothetical protein [Cohnella zeiphila]